MDQEIHEELLSAKTLKTDAKGERIFTVLSDFLSKNVFHPQMLFQWQQMELLPWSGNIVG